MIGQTCLSVVGPECHSTSHAFVQSVMMFFRATVGTELTLIGEPTMKPLCGMRSSGYRFAITIAYSPAKVLIQREEGKHLAFFLAERPLQGI